VVVAGLRLQTEGAGRVAVVVGRAAITMGAPESLIARRTGTRFGVTLTMSVARIFVCAKDTVRRRAVVELVRIAQALQLIEFHNVRHVAMRMLRAQLLARHALMCMVWRVQVAWTALAAIMVGTALPFWLADAVATVAIACAM
jgi:hypothetical protein